MAAFLKAALCASLPFLLSASPLEQAPTYGPNNPAVVKVDCLAGTGSAFRVARGYYLSVRHVTHIGGCAINGRTIPDIWESPTQDFSIIRMDEARAKSLPIDCGGFVPGRRYVAVGHARGLDIQTRVHLVATGEMNGGFSVLRGVVTVIPGQSGGAVIDEATGKVVGTINVFEPMRGHSGSQALKDTAVCQ